MPRPSTRSDWILLGGTVAALGLAGCLAASNMQIGATATPGSPAKLSLGPGLLASAIAFACAAIAVGVDLQSSVARRLGAVAGTSVMAPWQGFAAVLGWGAVDAGMLHIVLAYPDWASQTFNFKVDSNPLPTALIVGVSAIMIIRSKIVKVGDVEWGFEWIYQWSSAQVLDAVHRLKRETKRTWTQQFDAAVRDVAKYATFYTDLETEVADVAKGKPVEMQTSLNSQLDSLRKAYGIGADKAAADAALNANPAARRILVSTIIDVLGTDDLAAWGKREKMLA